MRQEIKKYTLNDMAYINNILAAFCDKVTVYLVNIRDINVRFKTKNEKRIQDLKDKGYDLEITPKYAYRAKKVVVGVPIDIIAVSKYNHDYKSHGIVINILCSGITRADLQADIDRKEQKLINYLNIYKIPLNRLCVESSVGCEIKFSGTTCEVN
jgi:hypothetical protein